MEAVPSDMAAMLALFKKSFDLSGAGHQARATEYEARLLEAAQARGATDCLIVATVLQNLAVSMFNHGPIEQTAKAGVSVQALAPVVEHLVAALDIVQRRRAAGTLLAGHCRPEEELWERLTGEHVSYARKEDESVRAIRAESAPLTGYITFLHVASLAASLLPYMMARTVDVRYEQMEDCLTLLADAAELVRRPRILKDQHLNAEAAFMKGMQGLLDYHPVLASAPEAAKMLKSWLRLQHSGVLQQRGADYALRSSLRMMNDRKSAITAAAAAPGLRSCALESCGEREQHPAHFKACAACKAVAYCGKEHQLADWPVHKAACKAARKAAPEKS